MLRASSRHAGRFTKDALPLEESPNFGIFLLPVIRMVPARELTLIIANQLADSES